MKIADLFFLRIYRVFIAMNLILLWRRELKCNVALTTLNKDKYSLHIINEG
jgi:hypothetical protein